MTFYIILLTEAFAPLRVFRGRGVLRHNQGSEQWGDCDFIHTVCIHAVMSAGLPEALHGHLTLRSTAEFKSKTRRQPPTLTWRLSDCLSTPTHSYADTAHTATHSHSLPLGVFPAVTHSLMDEMKYPVLYGWIPAQVKLTGSNTLVSVLNEVLGDSESFLSSYSPWSLPLFPTMWWFQSLPPVWNELFGSNGIV